MRINWTALGVVVAAIVGLSFVGVWWIDRIDRRQILANALIGEVSALVQYEAGLPKVSFLERVLTVVKTEATREAKSAKTAIRRSGLPGAKASSEDDKIEPIDQPPERLFVIYESNADILGVLGSDLVEKIVGFYTVGNTLRERVRLFGGGRFMRFEPKDKVIWLEGHIKSQKLWKKLGNELISGLRDEADRFWKFPEADRFWKFQ